ncbi:pyocin knob domain-containing S74 family peptidase [uncultured Marinobacter sp.]|uniref:pyocin knob domain-containing S74 family peptidase n=1 Tax=uncultured Marinobacter sp. TaxID=187379 RepID=UPI0025986247|nr:pyocin knob domain-containing S74 family peptidase [uncultured Marinobacter sp.]
MHDAVVKGNAEITGQVAAGTFTGSGSGLTGTASLRATGTTKADVGLGNVPNWSSGTFDSRYLAIGANAVSATKLANINTTFTGKYPITVNVNGAIYSHTDATFEGSTGILMAPKFVGNGSGITGVNADTVDGKHASAFALASHSHNYLPLNGGGKINGSVNITGTTFWEVSASDTASQRCDARDEATNYSRLHWYGQTDAGATSNFRHAWYTGTEYINVTAENGGITFGGSVSATSFKGKATDSDKLDGVHASGFVKTPGSSSSFISSDSGGKVVANSTTVNGVYYSDVSLFGQPDGALHNQAYSSTWQHQIYGDYRSGQIAVRGKNNGTWQPWRTVWDSGNFNPASKANVSHSHNYLPLSGGTLTGAITLPGAVGLTGSSSTGMVTTLGGRTTSIGSRNASYSHYQSSTGNHYFYGTVTAQSNITAYSDRRVKTNLEQIPDALEKVQQLTGYTYDRTDLDTPRQMGVVAQDVQKVAPEAVTENPENGHLHVAYGNLVGLLIEAIKEQQTQIDELKRRVG